MKPLPWQYCECGCHGHELRIGDFYRWCFQELSGKIGSLRIVSVHLNSGHKWGTHLGTFKSFEEADDFVRAELKEHAKKWVEVFKDFL